MRHVAVLALVAVAVGLLAPGPMHTALAVLAFWAAYWIALECR